MYDQSHQILIAGANSELASALIARTINNSKYKLLLVSQSQQNMCQDNVQAAIRRIDDVNLTDEVDQQRLSKEVSDFFDGPFSVINFAGNFWLHKSLIRTEFTEICDLISSHYLTLCGVAKAVTSAMIAKGGGRLVALSCNSVSYNYPDMAPFTCAKAAVECFVKCYSNEYSMYNISAAALALPTMRTSRVIKEKPEGDHENYISPEELSEILLEQILTQGQYITGNIIRLFKYSRTFYHQGYYQRNPRQEG